MTAGALFGVVPGTIAASIGATAAATGSFLASRYFLREKVGARRPRNGRDACGLRFYSVSGLSEIQLFNGHFVAFEKIFG